MSGKRCGHGSVTAWSIPVEVEHEVMQMMRRIQCNDCEEWLPLGPANDSDPAVAVEIRAAEIAVNVGELTEWWMFVGNATHEELLGWRGAGGPPLAAFDFRVQMRAALVCLARNLLWAASLCAAHEIALNEAEGHRLYHQFGYRSVECWAPGCGKAAP